MATLLLLLLAPSLNIVWPASGWLRILKERWRRWRRRSRPVGARTRHAVLTELPGGGLEELPHHLGAVFSTWLLTSAEAAAEPGESGDVSRASAEGAGPCGLGRRLWLRLTGICAAFVLPARRVPWVAVGLVCLVLAGWFLHRGLRPGPAPRPTRRRRRRPAARPSAPTS